jgi:sulfatase maturation enzyme AslB (radical SAM superfamily)
MSVQFSGGEPTMHPRFTTRWRYARKIGYNSVQAATNGIEFAKSKEFCKQAFEAGMRYAYLQFDGIGNDANSHRQVGNLFDVKLRAIENMHEAGIEIVLVTTIVNNVNNDQVGPIVKFAMENPRKSPSSPSSRFPSPGATRTSLRNAACASATRFRTWRRTSARRWAKSSRRATGSRFRSSARSRAFRTWYTAPTRSGARSPAAATRTAAWARR